MSLFARLSLALRMRLVIVALILGPLLCALVAVLALRHDEAVLRQDQTRDRVDAALSLIKAQFDRAQAGEVDQATAQRDALAALASLRDDSGGYYWVTDFDARLLMHPQRPDLTGHDLRDFRDVEGRSLFMEFADTARQRGAGFVFYRWPKPGHQAPVAKMSYVAAFAPWHWAVAFGVYDAEMGASPAPLRWLVGIAVVLAAVGGVLGWSAQVAGRREIDLRRHRERERLTLLDEAAALREECHLLMEHGAEGILVMEQRGQCTAANSRAVEMLGYDSAAGLIGQDLAQMIHHSDVDGTPCPPARRPMLKALAGEPVAQEEAVFWTAEGRSIPVSYRAQPILHDGIPTGAAVFFSENSERLRSEESMRLIRTLFSATAESIMICDRNNRIREVNPAFCRSTGYAPHEVIGRDPKVLESGRHDKAFYAAMWSSLRDKGRWEGEIWNRRKNGEVLPEWLTIAAIRDHTNAITEYLAVFTDMALRRRDEERLRRQDSVDALTELPNRKSFTEGLGHVLGRARADKGRAALLAVELGQQRGLWETHGQVVGDRVLQMAAKRLRRVVRETDMVGRLGENAFAILLEDLGQADDVTLVCEKVITNLGQRPFRVDGQEIGVDAHLGVALFPADAGDADILLTCADTAMDRARQEGRNGFRFYST